MYQKDLFVMNIERALLQHDLNEYMKVSNELQNSLKGYVIHYDNNKNNNNNGNHNNDNDIDHINIIMLSLQDNT